MRGRIAECGARRDGGSRAGHVDEYQTVILWLN
jgi:hypothetical protein